MLVNHKHYRTIWLKENNDKIVQVIDQRYLPHQFMIEDIATFNEMVIAIRDMHIRGAGLIGAAAGFAMYLAVMEGKENSGFSDYIKATADRLVATRPTAVNLQWAVNRQVEAINKGKTFDEKLGIAKQTAVRIADEDAAFCREIGQHGLPVFEAISRNKNGEVVNILTHCNAGWLAFVDFGSALSPVFEAHSKGIKVHVWVDETRPRNQGSSLTAWELLNQGIPHTIITDNAGGHLMQHRLVDVVITGADRVTRSGDVANKIGTYLKALAAFENHIPFYVAFPSSTIDWTIRDGISEIPIEQRDPDEVKFVQGLADGKLQKVLIAPAKSNAANYGFDVTPARFITGFITERGICKASEPGLMSLFNDR